MYKQIARRQSTGSTVHVSVEGPGRETQQDDLCSSALESLMEDRAMDPEMVSIRCCCCCRAGSCRGQINDDRQAFTGMSSFSPDLLLVNYRHRHWSLFPVHVVASSCRLLSSQPRLSIHHGSLRDGTAPGMQSKTSSPSAEALDDYSFNGLVTAPLV